MKSWYVINRPRVYQAKSKKDKEIEKDQTFPTHSRCCTNSWRRDHPLPRQEEVTYCQPGQRILHAYATVQKGCWETTRNGVMVI